MPRLAPEKRAAGTWTPSPTVQALPALTRPDQTRYGPKPPPEPADTLGIRYTGEGGGTVATCRVCGWLRWYETSAEAHRVTREHSCHSGDRCLLCGPPYRLGKDGCPHLQLQREEVAGHAL